MLVLNSLEYIIYKGSEVGNVSIRSRCIVIKFIRIYCIVGHPQDPKGEYNSYLSTFRAENIPKSRRFKVKNNAETLPKQLQKNFKNVQ